jgi:hypothetical protein
MGYESDKYGSHVRENMKRSMEKPFVAYNRRQHPRKDSIDITMVILGWMIGALAVGVVAAQVAIHYGWRP